jgi:hypothetical protein
MTFPQKVTWPKNFLLLFSVLLHKKEYIPGVLMCYFQYWPTLHNVHTYYASMHTYCACILCTHIMHTYCSYILFIHTVHAYCAVCTHIMHTYCTYILCIYCTVHCAHKYVHAYFHTFCGYLLFIPTIHTCNTILYYAVLYCIAI